MHNKTDKKRISLIIYKQLLEKIDDASKSADIPRSKYLQRVLEASHNCVKVEVKNPLEAINFLSKNAHAWAQLPREFRTYEVFCALASVCPTEAASIMEQVPPKWWSLLNKETIIKKAAENTKVLYNLPCEYRNDALTYICETAKKLWDENDKNSAKGKRKNPQIEIF